MHDSVFPDVWNGVEEMSVLIKGMEMQTSCWDCISKTAETAD